MKKIFAKITKIVMVFTMIFSQFCSLITVNAIEKPTLVYDSTNKTINLDVTNLNYTNGVLYTYKVYQTFYDVANNEVKKIDICSGDKATEIVPCTVIEDMDEGYNGKIEFSATLDVYDSEGTGIVTQFALDGIDKVYEAVTDNEIEVTYEVERLNDSVTNEPTDKYLIKFNFDKGDIYTNNSYTYEITDEQSILTTGTEVEKDMTGVTQAGVYKFNYNVDIKDLGVSILQQPKTVEVEIAIGDVDAVLNEENTTGIEFTSAEENEAKYTYSDETTIPTISDVETYLKGKGYDVEVKRNDVAVTEGSLQEGDVINLTIANTNGSYSYVVRLVYEEPVIEPIEEVIVEEIVETEQPVATTMVNTVTNNTQEVVEVETEEINEEVKKDDTKKEEKTNNSVVVKVIVVILIVLVIACLVYLIFRDEEKVAKKEKDKKQIKKRK